MSDYDSLTLYPYTFGDFPLVRVGEADYGDFPRARVGKAGFGERQNQPELHS